MGGLRGRRIAGGARISPRRGRRRARERGSLLLDALAALCIVAVGFVVFLGSARQAGMISVRQGERVLRVIEGRNADAGGLCVVFTGK